MVPVKRAGGVELMRNSLDSRVVTMFPGENFDLTSGSDDYLSA